MRIGIFGMGAVGCALLNELNGYEGLYVLADKKRIERYNKDGFVINDNTIYPRCSDNVACDVIFVCVKNYDLEQALIDLKPFVNDDTIIIPLLNGIKAHDIIKEAYSNNRVLYGVINVEANKLNNVAKVNKILKLQFGEANNTIKPEYLKELEEVLLKYNVTYFIPEDMIRSMWTKWLLNMGINQLSTLFNYTYKQMADPNVLEVMFNIFDEVMTVARAYDVNITEGDLKATKDRCVKFSSNKVTSLTVDFYNRDKNEIDSFGGALIKLAEAKNIAVPVNRTIYSLLKGLEQNKI